MYQCCDTLRRDLVSANNARPGATLINGIDYLEVLDHEALPGLTPQRTLLVYLLLPVPALTSDNVVIEGGVRIQNIKVVWAAPASNPPPEAITHTAPSNFTGLPNANLILAVATSSNGDHSTYTLRLVASVLNGDDSPPAGFDPRLCAIDFSFKVECPTQFDCAAESPCPPPAPTTPAINYLAKDYASFRALILDRLSQLVPGWNATSAADLGITLAELIAYVGDNLSYQQDAVTTEAYLNTARRRVSLRRHALLMDYHVSDGCNARTWVQVQVNADGVPLAKSGTRFYTRVIGLPGSFAAGSREAELAAQSGAQVFEPMIDATLYQAHQKMPFYCWGDTRCCLPIGATAATLSGTYPNLAVGDVLIFQEMMGPTTGDPRDADPSHRCAVQLTAVTATVTGGGPLTDPLPNPDGSLNPITEIAWSSGDALTFPVCLSSITDSAHGSLLQAQVSVALGNIVPADHGLTLTGENLGYVPEPIMNWAPDPAADRCNTPPPVAVPPRYRPTLANSPLTQAGSAPTVKDPATKLVSMVLGVSAAAMMTWTPDEVTPAITLTETGGPQPVTWNPQRDLLDSAASACEFVAETESDGTTSLRFGDNVNGAQPDPGMYFTADYRVGNGTAGNVGAESIAHVLALDARITGVINPLSATGGIDPETADQIRRRAPQQYQTQERAVTAADYVARANQFAGVERTAANFRWTGSWHTVFITVDPVGGGAPPAGLETDLESYLESYRMAGYDLQLDAPQYVSLEVDLLVCVEPNYLRSEVETALLEVLGNKALPDGLVGLFYPDNFTFGQTVYLSPIYAAARGVEGVASVRVTAFQRQGIDDSQYLIAGEMKLGALEIARLDNDPNFPENGLLGLTLCGGR